MCLIAACLALTHFFRQLQAARLALYQSSRVTSSGKFLQDSVVFLAEYQESNEAVGDAHAAVEHAFEDFLTAGHVEGLEGGVGHHLDLAMSITMGHAS